MPFILSLFGSNASTKDGIPIVTVLINVSWIGIKGYGILTNKNIEKEISENIEAKTKSFGSEVVMQKFYSVIEDTIKDYT